MDPKALSKLCNFGGELPQLSNSCQQQSARGTEQERGCRISTELLVAYGFVECNSSKWNLARRRVPTPRGRNAVKPFLSLNGQQIAQCLCEQNQQQSNALENRLCISHCTVYFGNHFCNTQFGDGSLRQNIISFSHISGLINRETELSQIV